MIKLCDLGMKYTKKRIRGGSKKIWETQKKARWENRRKSGGENSKNMIGTKKVRDERYKKKREVE